LRPRGSKGRVIGLPREREPGDRCQCPPQVVRAPPRPTPQRPAEPDRSTLRACRRAGNHAARRGTPADGSTAALHAEDRGLDARPAAAGAGGGAREALAPAKDVPTREAGRGVHGELLPARRERAAEVLEVLDDVPLARSHALGEVARAGRALPEGGAERFAQRGAACRGNAGGLRAHARLLSASGVGRRHRSRGCAPGNAGA
jgi:hypothetical protein